jgi:methionine-rich copper-binding protein CopC
MDVVPRLIASILAAAVVLVLGAGVAHAHATVVATDPKDGARLASTPSTVALTVSEQVESGSIVVTAPDGSAVRTSKPRVDGRRLSTKLAESDQQGRYTVAYRVISADGHPVLGTFTFTTTTGREVEQEDRPATDSPDRVVTLLLIGAAVGVATMVVLLVSRRREAHT